MRLDLGIARLFWFPVILAIIPFIEMRCGCWYLHRDNEPPARVMPCPGHATVERLLEETT